VSSGFIFLFSLYRHIYHLPHYVRSSIVRVGGKVLVVCIIITVRCSHRSQHSREDRYTYLLLAGTTGYCSTCVVRAPILQPAPTNQFYRATVHVVCTCVHPPPRNFSHHTKIILSLFSLLFFCVLFRSLDKESGDIDKKAHRQDTSAQLTNYRTLITIVCLCMY
jgi:hypothetical protein